MKENIMIIRDFSVSHAQIGIFPDGQLNLKIDLDFYDIKTPIKIKCNILQFKDFEVLLMAIAALHKNDRVISKIQFMYLMGMRSDRAFEIGTANYFRDVIAPLVNQIEIPKEIFMPHSRISMAALTRAHEMKYYARHATIGFAIGGDTNAPYDLFQQPTFPSIHFHKKRENREIKVELSKECIAAIKNLVIENEMANHVTIIDDLCDGGGTFVAEAKYLKNLFPNLKLKLFVIHGIFSKGLDELLSYFDEIITTNSYQQINHAKVTCIDVFGEN